MQINCMNCGAPVGESAHCPKCGFDVVVQKKVYLLSNLYYNQGLEKAEIRDLSGAIDLLQRSLKFNKLNIQARNLLGLVYFETGEAVSALSEWVISKNIMPENNIAEEYINRLQSNVNKLDLINQTIKKYNEALQCCRNGSPDVAAIQLKKILTQNPKLIKAYHLLALIYIERKEYGKARRILRKAIKIDRTNSTSLRFLKEVDEQTGTHTRLESRWELRRMREMERGRRASGTPDVIIPSSFHESSVFSTIVNMGFGLIVGALVVWFLFMPARTQRINQEANKKVVEYSNTMASQSAELSKMEDEISESKETVSSAKDQISEAQKLTANYENLIKAWAAYRDENYTNAANSLAAVESEKLSVEAKAIYDDIHDNIQSILFSSYKNAGVAAFESGDYATAITQLTQAMELNDADYEVLNYLAHAYRESKDNENAIRIFQMIIDQNPDTRRASSAQAYIDAINSGVDIDAGDISGDAQSQQNREGDNSDEDYGDEESSYEDEEEENFGNGDEQSEEESGEESSEEE